MKQVVPCVIFAYNRPHKLSQVLSALYSQKVSKLEIFVDGPASKEDQHLVNQCYEIAQNVTWANKEIHFHPQNHGLSGLIENIDLVFQTFEKAIFIEDDCLPMPGFYNFMVQALDHYIGEKSVFSIGGYQPIPASHFQNYPYSVVACPRFTCWGWGTWHDRWENILPLIHNFKDLFNHLKDVPDLAGPDFPHEAPAMAEGKIRDSWDLKVAVATLYARQVHLLPTRGLVKNIGQDLSGMHHSRFASMRGVFLHNRNIDTKILKKPIWIDDITINPDYTEDLVNFVRNSSGRKIRRKIQQEKLWLKRLATGRHERIFNLNLANNRSEKLTHRALFSYISDPIFIPRDDERFFVNTNIFFAQEFVRALNQMGYIVDVIDFRDTDFKPQHPYDVFIGHGGINYLHIANKLPDSTNKIFFSTGTYWKFANDQEKARFDALYERKGVRLPYDRMVIHNEEGALLASEAILGIGNDITKLTYQLFNGSTTRPVIMINGTALKDVFYEWRQKDFNLGRQHFLFFAGGGSVHKGLDLLLDAFSGLQQHLWICSKVDQEFQKVYHRELKSYPNIHFVGSVQLHTASFYRVMQTCNFTILPSASEGQSQATVECLNQGLIPIVSKYSGLDVDGYGEILESCKIDEIREAILRISSYSKEKCKNMSEDARQASVTVFSEDKFRHNLRASLERLISTV